MSEPNKANELIQAHLSCSSGESDVFQILKFGVQLCYLIPFGLLYISFIVSIIQKRKDRELFEDSFFTLYLVDGAVTITFLLLDISFFRLTSYIRPVCEIFIPFLSTPAYYLTPYYTLYLYAQFAKMLSTLTMSINRYTSINFPFLHKTIWVQHCSKSIAATLLIPVLFVWPVAIARTNFAPFQGQGLIGYEHKFLWARTTYGRILIGGITLLFTVYSSVITTAKLSKLGNHMRKVEVSMNIATLFVSAGFVLQLILQVSYLTFDADILVTAPWIAMLVLELAQVVNDFYMLSGPVVLLILDKRIRLSIFSCFKRHNKPGNGTDVSVRAVTSTEAKQRVT